LPFAGFKTFSDCVSAQRRKGKSPESAKKICGALQARAEGKTANAAQIPQDYKPHYNRSVKALDFLKQQGVLLDEEEQEETEFAGALQNDTSLDNQTPPQPVQLSNGIYSDPESYTDKITRIMDEYNISEDEAKQIVGKIIENDMVELNRREYEVTKQLAIEKAQAGMITSSEDGQQQKQQKQQEENQENVSNENNSSGVESEQQQSG
jgi:hypothetical protein